MSPRSRAADAAASPRIRRMTAADVPEVLRLERRLFPADPWPAGFFYDELAQAEPAADGRAATRTYWVAEEPRTHGSPAAAAPGGILACAGMMCVLPLCDVQTLAVTPSAQGRGLGSRLLTLIAEESRNRGADDLLLEVRADNPDAQRLYLRHGFEEIHQRRRYYPDGGDALIMRKHLKDPAASTAANLRSARSDAASGRGSISP